jgi:alpha-beta hydrolase superfamily lysophospholipase
MPEPPEHNAPHDRATRHRRRWRLIALGSIVGLGVVLLVALKVLVSSTSPTSPSKFYALPSPLSPGPPGTVIRTETIGNPPAGSVAWKILYLSKSYTGEPTAVSGLLFVPTTPPPASGRDVVTMTHGTTGVAPSCAPSNLGPTYWPHVEGLSESLRAGYAVVASDYQGLGTPSPHPYLVGDSEAWGALDAVRAAHMFAPAHAGTRFIVWGTSQGGQASLFTGQDAASYAPELKLLGVAAAAPATDLKQLFELNRNTPVGRILSAFTIESWSQVYPQLQLDQVVTPFAQPIVKRIARICLVGEGNVLGATLLSQALKVGYLHDLPWETEPWKSLLARNSASAMKIPAPVYIAQGEADTLVHPPVTAAFAKRLCRAGEALVFRTYPGATHIQIAARSASDISAWVAQRFAGKPAPKACAM